MKIEFDSPKNERIVLAGSC